MPDYTVEFRWDISPTRAVLWITLQGNLLSDPQSIPTIIDQAHAYADRYEGHKPVCLAYDLSSTEQQLPLAALMRRTRISAKVKRVAIIGARARTDEMAVIIMANAKRIPFEFKFFKTREAAHNYLHGVNHQGTR
ncbi:MAG: hypothetical protein JXJ20_02215 [Anaerolineae bacterium]|jgi:hypothetical protein|nr:hypothetical protein [Anaerolineae bacterium]